MQTKHKDRITTFRQDLLKSINEKLNTEGVEPTTNHFKYLKLPELLPVSSLEHPIVEITRDGVIEHETNKFHDYDNLSTDEISQIADLFEV